MNEVEILIIGAGGIGLAIARETAMRVREVLVVGVRSLPGNGISSRKAVSHQGIVALFMWECTTLQAVRKTGLLGVIRGEIFKIAARQLFVATGLHSVRLCRGALVAAPLYCWLLPKGFWLERKHFVLDQPASVKPLIYPVTNSGGVGVYLTLDLAGSARFGPYTESVAIEDYCANSERGGNFEEAIRCFRLSLPDNLLVPGYARIRQKLRVSLGGEGNFCLDGPGELGIDGLVALHGIESYGLTLSLSRGATECSNLFE